MDRMMLEVLTRIADNLFLIRETLECMQPKPPEDDGDEEAYDEFDDVPWAGCAFVEHDEICKTCKHDDVHDWRYCRDCKHMTEHRQADRYTRG